MLQTLEAIIVFTTLLIRYKLFRLKLMIFSSDLQLTGFEPYVKGNVKILAGAKILKMSKNFVKWLTKWSETSRDFKRKISSYSKIDSTSMKET